MPGMYVLLLNKVVEDLLDDFEASEDVAFKSVSQ